MAKRILIQDLKTFFFSLIFAQPPKSLDADHLYTWSIFHGVVPLPLILTFMFKTF